MSRGSVVAPAPEPGLWTVRDGFVAVPGTGHGPRGRARGRHLLLMLDLAQRLQHLLLLDTRRLRELGNRRRAAELHRQLLEPFGARARSGRTRTERARRS